MDHFTELETLLENASAPYSGFQVASIVVAKNGETFQGVNVESVAYLTTMCAERTAIFSAVAQGMKSGALAEVHILARNAEGDFVPAFPCGACRQVIAEQSLNKAVVYVYHKQNEVTEHSISALLPHAFFSLD